LKDFLDNNPLALVPLFVLLWCAVVFSIAAFSGWMNLARRFRLSSAFTGPSWGLQSAYMRWASRYRSCLNIGADATGLKLSVLFLFRVGHPPLLVPWSEISVARRRKFLFVRQVKLLLGREEQIPFVIGGGLADRIQAAAGASWPIEAIS
jgi:hypothetical protein